jgi:hypothetical protein
VSRGRHQGHDQILPCGVAGCAVDCVVCGPLGGGTAWGVTGFVWVAGFESLGVSVAGGAGFFFAGLAEEPDAAPVPEGAVPAASGAAGS